MEIARTFGQGYGYEAPAYRQAGVSFRVERLRELLKTKNVTQSCPELRTNGFSPIMVSLSNHAVTVRRDIYFLTNAPCPEGARET